MGDIHMRPARQSFARQDGFTLMELLIVIAIMAVLSGILLPTLNKGRSRSQAISCLNNLRQLQMAFQMYTHDNADILPANNFVDALKIGAGVGAIVGPSWCPGDPRNDFTTENVQKGELFPYTRSVAIYHCPADYSKLAGPTGDMLRTRSYSMSGSINSDITTHIMPGFRKASEMRNPQPSDVFVFLDVNENCISDGHFAIHPDSADVPKEQRDQWINMPSDRHGQAGNLSFADGHLERWLWNAPKKFDGWNQKAEGKDLQDLRKLQRAIRQN